MKQGIETENKTFKKNNNFLEKSDFLKNLFYSTK